MLKVKTKDKESLTTASQLLVHFTNLSDKFNIRVGGADVERIF
jgi:hypothetical protein